MLHYALIFEDVVANILTNNPNNFQFEPGLEWVAYDPASVRCQVGWKYLRVENRFEPMRKSLEEEKLRIMEKVNRISDEYYTKLINGYPQSEVASFYRQELEAERFTRGDFRTPFLDVIAKKRGLPIEELVQRVLFKAEIIAPMLAEPISIRQHYEDQVLAAENYEQLDEIESAVDRWEGDL